MVYMDMDFELEREAYEPVVKKKIISREPLMSDRETVEVSERFEGSDIVKKINGWEHLKNCGFIPDENVFNKYCLSAECGKCPYKNFRSNNFDVMDVEGLVTIAGRDGTYI